MDTSELLVAGHHVRAHELGEPDEVTPTFVLLHGLGVSSTYFVPLAERLADHGRVVLLDLPGFAGLPTPPTPLGIADFAAIVRLTLDELAATGPFVLVGHSMGAQVVAELVANPREGIVGAMLIGPVVNPDERSLPRLLGRFAQSALRESPANAGVATAAHLRCGPRWFAETLPALLHYPIERRLQGVATPLLVVGGEFDTVSPVGFRDRLAALVPESRVITLAGAAHGVLFDHADVLAAELLTLAGGRNA